MRFTLPGPGAIFARSWLDDLGALRDQVSHIPCGPALIILVVIPQREGLCVWGAKNLSDYLQDACAPGGILACAWKGAQ